MTRTLSIAVFCLLAAPAFAIDGVYEGERDDFTFELTITQSDEAGADYTIEIAIHGTRDVPDDAGVLRRDGDDLETANSADGPFNHFGRVATNGDIMVADGMSDGEFRAERIGDAP